MLQNEKFTAFREKYKKFIYNGWQIKRNGGKITVSFDFYIDGLCEFHPTTEIDISNLDVANPYNSYEANKIIFNLGMVELISYWKCACPPEVEIKCGWLSQYDISWWKKLYFGGLSEFFYVNSVETDEESFMNITVNDAFRKELEESIYNKTGINVIPVGGGKDSCVTAHLLKPFGSKNKFFTVNDQQARTDTVISAGYCENDIIRTHRTIDKNLLKLNSEGFLNGHTPFSAIVAFLSLYCAYLIGGEYIVLSNESSANESNIKGTNVNHQYSKSYEFECDFTDYVERNILSGIKYFSILRPFSELQIAKMFASLPEYHKTFRSCNRGSKKNIWCAKCAKCLFVFTILAPFCNYNELSEIFGNDMLNDPDMTEDFDGLAGFSEVKPFECVGTKSEFSYALWALINKLEKENKDLPVLCKRFKEKADFNALDKNLLNDYNPMNNVPDEFLFAVKEMYENVSCGN